jgi:hypothetical protein
MASNLARSYVERGMFESAARVELLRAAAQASGNPLR